MNKLLSTPVGYSRTKLCLNVSLPNIGERVHDLLQGKVSLQSIFSLLPSHTAITRELIQKIAYNQHISEDDTITQFFQYCHGLILSGQGNGISLFNIDSLRSCEWGMSHILEYARGFNIGQDKEWDFEKKFMHQYADVSFRLYLLGINDFHNIWWEGSQNGANQLQKTLKELTNGVHGCSDGSISTETCSQCKNIELARIIAFCETIHSLMGLEMANMQRQEHILSLSHSIVKEIEKIVETFSFDTKELQAIQCELLYTQGRQLLAFQQLEDIAGNTLPEISQNTDDLIRNLKTGMEIAVRAIQNHPVWERKIKEEKLNGINRLFSINSEYVRGIGTMKKKKICDNLGDALNGEIVTIELQKTCRYFVNFYNSPDEKNEKSVQDFIGESLAIPSEKWDFGRLAILHNLLIFEEYIHLIGEEKTMKIVKSLTKSVDCLGGAFPEFRIKACARAIEILRYYGDSYSKYIATVERFIKIHESHLSPIPGYSRLHLAFSIYYSEMEGPSAITKAMESFAHYSDIVGGDIPTKLQSYKTRLFLRFGGGKKEFIDGHILPLSKLPENVSAEKAGELIFGHFNVGRDAQKRLLFSQTLDTSGIRNQDMEVPENEYISRLSGIVCPLIKDIFFHNHCEVFLQKSSVPVEYNSVFHASESFHINKEYSLYFIYPKRFEGIFATALEQSKQYVTHKIDGLLREYSNQGTIREQKTRLLEAFSRNSITGLYNEKSLTNTLEKDPDGFRTIALIQIPNLGDIGRTLGEQRRQSIMQRITQSLPKYLEEILGYAGFSMYHFEDGTFCLDFLTPIDTGILGDQLAFFFEKWNLTGPLSSNLDLLPDSLPYTLIPKIGIAHDKGKDAYENAERALNESRSSRNIGFVVHTPAMNTRESEGVHIGHLLSRAITGGKITPYCQAIVDNTRKVVKYECLLRFAPDSELSDSAKYPLWKVLSIGKNNPHILHGVLKGVIKKDIPKNIPLSFNLSNVDMESPRLVESLLNYVETSGRRSQDTTIEVLEERMDFSPNALNNLKKLKEHGFIIALDDFGSRNSNIDRLIKLKGLVDVIKLDGIVVEFNNPINIEFIKSVVAIAKIIHVKTLVERVETYEQYIILRALGIDYFQGYFFHKPAPLPDYVKKPETFLEKTHKWFIFSRYTDIRRQAGELINNFVTQLVLLIRK